MISASVVGIQCIMYMVTIFQIIISNLVCMCALLECFNNIYIQCT